MATNSQQMAAAQNLTTDVADSTAVHVDIGDDVSAALRTHNIDAPTWSDTLRVRSHGEIPGAEVGAYVTPDFTTDGTATAAAIRDGRGALSFKLRSAGPGEANDEGRELFTAVAQNGEWTTTDIVDHLVETGQFKAAVDEVRPVVRDDVEPTHVVAWAVATYLKGVIAEQVITSTDDFSKAGVSNDQAGDDVYDNTADDRPLRQVKCVTCNDAPDHVLWYQFDGRGNIHYGDDRSEVAQAAIEDIPHVGDGRCKGVVINSTLTYRTHTSYTAAERPCPSKDRNGTYRYIGW